MMDGWRYVLRVCGDLYVMTVGMKEMQKWCVDNWGMVEVSLLGNTLYYYLMQHSPSQGLLR